MNYPIKRVEFVRKYLDGIFTGDVHPKRDLVAAMLASRDFKESGLFLWVR